ncbi:MAG TPA: hypothetical protein VL500_03935 [Candidatus Eisenbacteria bacterium]|nr:hypothetical protein [Candidatus Eisenbacteria bacterium]
MAVPSLPKLKAIKLTKLQALLLLGGAFVLAGAGWLLLNDRLVLDATSEAPASSLLVLQFLPKKAGTAEEEASRKFLAALPPEAQSAAAQAAPGRTVILFATPGQGDALQWGTLETQDARQQGRPVWRLVPKKDGAIGSVTIDGRKQPLEAVFGEDSTMFRIGRTYRGLLGDGPALGGGRRMRMAFNQEMFYLEKPEGASWEGATGLLGPQMQRFPALSSFWTLPGRTELFVSASRTDAVFQPFSLYYRPAASLPMPRTTLEKYAKELLADALPHPIDIQLPDGSHMQELRHDAGGVVADQKQNQFGDIVKYTYPGEKTALYAFYAKDGEAWLTTDMNLIQAILLATVGAAAPGDACHKGGQGGFASVPGTLLPIQNGFKNLTVSIHSLETGLFTICGYY